MTVLRGFVITILSGIAFALLGGGIGYGLGKFAPGYYRFVFRVPPEVRIDPAQAGIGLGITQGLVTGLFVGLLIVLAVSWYHSRVMKRET